MSTPHLLYIVRCLCLWSAGSSTLAEGDALNEFNVGLLSLRQAHTLVLTVSYLTISKAYIDAPRDRLVPKRSSAAAGTDMLFGNFPTYS